MAWFLRLCASRTAASCIVSCCDRRSPACIGKYVPPAPGTKSPAQWGTKARLDELFGETARDIHVTRRDFVFRYRSPAQWIDIVRTYYGPMNKTCA
ncbi:MAG: hypothetical protein ABI981_14595, partial [Betaproteobacteria bacterium]